VRGMPLSKFNLVSVYFSNVCFGFTYGRVKTASVPTTDRKKPIMT
jgi:hypothetical protein